MKALSNLAQSVRASTTLAIDTQFNKMRSEGIDVIGFSVGQPDFPTPEHIKQAGIRAIQENLTKYTPTPGTPAVRKAVADAGRCWSPTDLWGKSSSLVCLGNGPALVPGTPNRQCRQRFEGLGLEVPAKVDVASYRRDVLGLRS